MTKQEAITNHRKMWRWIADETRKWKIVVIQSDYFDTMGISKKDRPRINCYCCEYDDDKSGGHCTSCPIEWPTGHCSHGGLFSRWVDAFFNSDWITAAAIAQQIAELPEREDV